MPTVIHRTKTSFRGLWKRSPNLSKWTLCEVGICCCASVQRGYLRPRSNGNSIPLEFAPSASKPTNIVIRVSILQPSNQIYKHEDDGIQMEGGPKKGSSINCSPEIFSYRKSLSELAVNWWSCILCHSNNLLVLSRGGQSLSKGLRLLWSTDR